MYILGFYRSSDTAPYAVYLCDGFDDTGSAVIVRMEDRTIMEEQYGYFIAADLSQDLEVLERFRHVVA